MKRSTPLIVLLFLILGPQMLSAPALAGSFCALAGFNKNVDRALNKERLGRSDEARQYWARVAELGEELLADSPGRTEYLLGTARAHYGLGEYARAIELYEALLANAAKLGKTDLARSYAWVYVYLGLSWARQDNAAKALEYWKQVPVNIGPVYGSIQEQIALLEQRAAGAEK